MVTCGAFKNKTQGMYYDQLCDFLQDKTSKKHGNKKFIKQILCSTWIAVYLSFQLTLVNEFFIRFYSFRSTVRPLRQERSNKQ